MKLLWKLVRKFYLLYTFSFSVGLYVILYYLLHSILSLNDFLGKFSFKKSRLVGSIHIKISYLLIFLKKFVYFWERERKCTWASRGEIEKEWEPKQALSCQHRTWCGVRIHELWDHELKPRVRLSTNGVTQVPHKQFELYIFGEWINMIQYIHTMKYYSVLK